MEFHAPKDNKGVSEKRVVDKTKEPTTRKKFSRKAVIGLLLLVCSFCLGVLLRNSAQITDEQHPRGFSGVCDTYITWLCIPTYYVSIPLTGSIDLVVNMTSFLASTILFISGVIMVRE